MAKAQQKKQRHTKAYIVPAAKLAAINDEIRRAIGPGYQITTPLVPSANPNANPTHYGVEFRGLRQNVIDILEVLRKPTDPPNQRGICGKHGAEAYDDLLDAACAKKNPPIKRKK